MITEGARLVKVDSEWSRVNRAWLHQRYEEQRLLLKALEDCRAGK
jgi:hypothetical protein